MTKILAGRAAKPSMDWASLDGVFRLRDEVFHKRLGWDAVSQGRLERDKFDDMDPVYLIPITKKRRVDECTRLLHTTGPYMLSGVIPQLLQGKDAPQDAFT